MSYQVSEIVQGTVTRILPYGAMMVFEDEWMGLLHISEVSNEYIRNIYRYLRVGAIYQVKVLSVDNEKKFLKVSLKLLTEEERKTINGLNERNKALIDGKALTSKLNDWIKLELDKEKKDVNS
ncbi:MAG: S1 RNA-binding domain-containing protein [Bacilli bacterium]|nr:S1 RNA-binding domain-containing protein [Bacilli bacterium]